MNHEPSGTRSFLSALYAVSALLLVAPFTDLLGLTWPVRSFDAGWRFGSIGLGFEKAFIQVIGLSLGMGLAAVLGHRRVLRLLAGFSLATAFLVCAAMVRFLLDFGDLRAFLPAADVASFDANAFRASLYATLAIPVLVVLGGRGWAAAARPDLRNIKPEHDQRVIPLYRHNQS
ncbi:MAG: hypothetical protein ACREL7_09695 [Longimicrobiales bacterium]